MFTTFRPTAWPVLFGILSMPWPAAATGPDVPEPLPQGPTHAAEIAAPSSFGLGDRSAGFGLSRDYNPAMGASLLLGGGWLSRDLEKSRLSEGVRELMGRTGISFQEAEVSMAAAVDPYFRADLIIAIHNHDGAFAVDIEEGFVTTLFLRGVTFRAGKFYIPFGRHNALHAHAFPFIDSPLPNRVFFGEEGLNEAAVEASVLLPLPWFVEWSVDLANGDNGVLFASRRSRDLAFSTRLHTLVELSDSTTLEFGGSYVVGCNVAGGWSHVAGGDLTLKWRPEGRELYHQIVWQSEYIRLMRTGPHPVLPLSLADGEEVDATLEGQVEVASGLGGFYSHLAAQVAQRFWVEGRFDAMGYPRGDGGQRLHRVSGLLAFVPSEFSAIRLQYSWLKEEAAHALMVQLSVGIGAHPAHGY